MLLLRLQVAARQHSVHQSDMFADNALLVAEAHRLGADLEGCDQNGFTPLLWAAHQVTLLYLLPCCPQLELLQQPGCSSCCRRLESGPSYTGGRLSQRS